MAQPELSFYGKLLGNPVASLGGQARAKSLSSKQRSSIASKAAKARWGERVSIEKAQKAEPASLSKHIFFG